MKIFYSLSGEGLGHAIRTTAILEHLNKEIEVHVFTWGEAYDFFKKQNYPHLHKVAGLPFGRDKKNRINTARTILSFFKFVRKFSSSFSYVARKAKELNPSLFVSDFETILPRVAHSLNYPLFSIDNQHRFSRCKLKDLPISLRVQAYFIGLLTELYVPRPNKVIISTFHYDMLKKNDNKTVITNCFMRKSFEKYEFVKGDYVLLYYKISFGDILDLLAKTDHKFKVYGCPKEFRTVPHFEYFDISGEGFMADLAGCKSLLCGAGNQLLGEAIYCGKSIFAIPVPNQPEQTINAVYVERMKRGVKCEVEELTTEKIDSFINNFEYKKGSGVNGAIRAAEEIHRYLGIC